MHSILVIIYNNDSITGKFQIYNFESFKCVLCFKLLENIQYRFHFTFLIIYFLERQRKNFQPSGHTSFGFEEKVWRIDSSSFSFIFIIISFLTDRNKYLCFLFKNKLLFTITASLFFILLNPSGKISFRQYKKA